MTTITQDMTDTAVTMEHLAIRMAEAHGDDNEEMRKHATELHGAVVILRGWADAQKEELRAAVDEDAPKELHDFEQCPSSMRGMCRRYIRHSLTFNCNGFAYGCSDYGKPLPFPL